jgi:hypothetical protein
MHFDFPKKVFKDASGYFRLAQQCFVLQVRSHPKTVNLLAKYFYRAKTELFESTIS